MKSWNPAKIVASFGALSAVCVSQASIYTVDFRGVIDTITGASVDDGSVNLGTVVTGEFQYETGLPVAGSFSGNLYYNSVGLTEQSEVKIGDYDLVYPSSEAIQYNIHPGGLGINLAAYSPPPPGNNLASLYFGLDTFGGFGWAPTTDLPSTPPRLDYFSDAEFDFTLAPYLDNSVPRTTGHGHFTLMQAVPEPPTCVALACGAGLIGVSRRRKSSLNRE